MSMCPYCEFLGWEGVRGYEVTLWGSHPRFSPAIQRYDKSDKKVSMQVKIGLTKEILKRYSLYTHIIFLHANRLMSKIRND